MLWSKDWIDAPGEFVWQSKLVMFLKSEYFTELILFYNTVFTDSVLFWIFETINSV